MGANLSRTAFAVDGRTVVIAGGSRGLGLYAGRQLAAMGANVLIVARDEAVLQEGVEFISKGARDAKSQRFHYISADVSKASECQRVISESIVWNDGQAPDILWCAAGGTHPTLFVDTPPEQFHRLMDVNYFSCVHMAQSILKAWLPKPKPSTKAKDKSSTSASAPTSGSTSVRGPARHIIFTGSFLSLYPIAGYAPYNPSKAAIRSLSDSLSQEMNLYEGAYPSEPKIKVHSIFPASILTQSFEEENLMKNDVTKMLEDGYAALSPEETARRAIRALERGEELITTDFETRLVMSSVMGPSKRGGFLVGFCNTIFACVMAVVMYFVRSSMDAKVRKFGREHGATGYKLA